jgi:YbbR domain-containing protein
MSRTSDILLRHVGPKLLALLLAVTIWYALRQITSYEILIEDVPLEFRVPDGLAVLEPSVETVDIYFQGSQEDLRLLDRKQIKVILALKRRGEEGETEETIHLQDVKGGGPARPSRIIPNTIRFQLDRRIEKQVPVKARHIGKPLRGEVDKMDCEPAAVTVWGPAQYVAGLELIHTEPVDVDGRVADFTKSSRVIRPEGGWASDITPPEVRVTVRIKEQSESRDLPEVPVLALLRPGAPPKATITPNRVTIRLTGHPDALDKASQAKPRVFVDCADLEPGVPYELPLTVSLAPGLNVAAVTEPRFVRVVLEVERP